MKRLLKIKHPKLTILALAIILAYLFFKDETIGNFVFSLGSLRYLGVFISGMLFTFGFTAPFSIGFFITYPAQNIILASIMAGLGSTLSTFLLFKWFKFSLKNEIEDIEKKKPFKEIIKLIESKIPHKIRIYLSYAFLGIVLATPIPNEFGTFLIAGLKKINETILILATFILSTVGIYIILILSA